MAQRDQIHLHGACSCGAFSFTARRAPIARFVCHCLCCQAFTRAPFSDVSVLRPQHVALNGIEALSFKKYRLPPNINRGRCNTCGQPALETMGAGPVNLLVFIPSVLFVEQDSLPPTRAHVFYNRRIGNANDALPKYEGYWPSQLAIMKLILGTR